MDHLWIYLGRQLVKPGEAIYLPWINRFGGKLQILVSGYVLEHFTDVLYGFFWCFDTLGDTKNNCFLLSKFLTTVVFAVSTFFFLTVRKFKPLDRSRCYQLQHLCWGGLSKHYITMRLAKIFQRRQGRNSRSSFFTVYFFARVFQWKIPSQFAGL